MRMISALCLLVALIALVAPAAASSPLDHLAATLARRSIFQPAVAPRCQLPASWSTTFPYRDVTPVYTAPTDRTHSGCNAIVTLQNSGTRTGRLAGVDMDTGKVAWNASFTVPADWYNSFVQPIVDSASVPSRVYQQVSTSQPGCRAVGASSYSRESGLKALWNTTVCGGLDLFPSLYAVPFASDNTELLLLVEWTYNIGVASRWTALDGSTGAVLHSDANMTATLTAPRTLGQPAEARLFVQQSGAGATSYQLAADGKWAVLATVPDDRSRLVGAQPFISDFGPAPRVLALQAVSREAGDHWTGVDMVTGKQVWNVSGDAIFTGAWAAAYPGVSAEDPFTQYYPLDARYLFVSATARNASTTLFQFGLLDTTTGHVTITSPVCATTEQGAVVADLAVVDASTIVVRQVNRRASSERWWAFSTVGKSALQLVSTGPYMAPADYNWTDLGYLAATEDGAALWWSAAGMLNGTVYKADGVTAQVQVA